MKEKKTGYTNPNPLARGTAAMLLILAALLGVSQLTSAADGEFVNISTRAVVKTGDEVMIGGFILADGPRQVAIHALGPELANRGVSNALADPVLRVIDTTDPGNIRELMFNDDWNDSQGQLLSDIWGPALPFTANSNSSAAVLTLEPGNYTAIVEGKNGTSGIALVEVWRIDSASGSQETTHGIGATLSDLPTGSWTPDVTSGGSFLLSGGNATVRLNNGGFIEEGNFRYTCQNSGGCVIENRAVTSGTIIQTTQGTAPGGGGTDTSPSFATGSEPGNQSYTVDTTISALTLPEASGGNSPLIYSLSPSVPGLTFNATTRRLTGSPTTAGSHSMNYTVTDADGDTDSLTFTVTVTEPPPPQDNYTPLEGLRVSAGRVQYSFFSAGGCIRLSNTTINGVTYTTHSSKWQRRANASSAWEDVPGTEEQGGLCAYNPTSPGEYRLVADISIGSRRGNYSSENTITVN